MRGRKRKLLIGAMAVAVTGLLAVLICFEKRESLPPTLSIARVEGAGMFDDSGLEMLMVTLSISAPGKPSDLRLFVKDSHKTIEAKVANRWVGMEGPLWAGGCELWPVEKRESLILVPAHTDSFRIRLRYTRALLTETRAASLARGLPSWMPCYRQVFGWLRNSPWRPRRSWREISIEVPFPLESARPVNMSDGGW